MTSTPQPSGLPATPHRYSTSTATTIQYSLEPTCSPINVRRGPAPSARTTPCCSWGWCWCCNPAHCPACLGLPPRDRRRRQTTTAREVQQPLDCRPYYLLATGDGHLGRLPAALKLLKLQVLQSAGGVIFLKALLLLLRFSYYQQQQ